MKKTQVAVFLVVVVVGLVVGCNRRNVWEKEGSRVDVNAQIEHLGSPNASTRYEATRYLEMAGPRAASAVPYLINILGDDSKVEFTTVGAGAAYALGSIGEAALEPVLATLQNSNMWIRRNAAIALGKIGDRRATQPLVALIADEEVGVRVAVVEALGLIGDRRAIEPLITTLSRDHDATLRTKAARSLGQIGGPDVIEPLVAALDDGDVGVRASAASALGEANDSRAVDPLIALINSDDSRGVRGAGVQALGILRDRRSIEPLIAVLDDDSSSNALRVLAADALAEITGQDLGQDSGTWREWLSRQ